MSIADLVKHKMDGMSCLRCGKAARDIYANAGSQECITKEQAEEQVLMAGGKVASTQIPPFHLIPTAVIEGIANRFGTGLENKGDKCWHATSNNQEVLLDVEFIKERIGHIMRHCLVIRDKIAANDLVGLQQDDDASAIAWGGGFLICAVKAIIEQNENG